MHLRQHGFTVPAFTVLPVSFFSSNDEATIRTGCRQMEPEWETLFGDGKRFAVRSSAVAEDGHQHSFAGQFTTLLDIPFEDLADAVVEVWRSGNNERVKAYQQATGADKHIAMAVIIQELIPATAAGVGFAINPLNGNQEIVINAVQGLGDKLVDGTVTAVTYIIAEQGISGLEHQLLNTAQLQQIEDCFKKLGQVYNHAQDIEFAFLDTQFYLLQSRRITARATGKKITWDNSNIIESYPGLTLPLTFSFIEKMYEAVYRQFSLVLGVSTGKVERNTAVYANMLGLLNGRVYYNLNSWYRSLAQLPGYSLNAPFMEKMMGVKEKPDIDLSDEPGSGKLSGWKEVLVALYRILKNLRHARKGKDEFIASFNRIYDQYKKIDYNTQPPDKIWQDYSRFEALMLKEWKAPLVNDFFAMIYFGLLQRQCNKYWPDNLEMHNHLVAASADIITTEPLKLLPRLAAQIAAIPELKTAATQATPTALWQQLQQPQYKAGLEAVEQYLDKWGERCIAELKLETVTYLQAPEKLIAILQTYITNGTFAYQENGDTLRQRIEAEETALRSLKGVKKRIFKHILKQARYFISNRENLRYYRTKGFGMVRRMMSGLGVQFHRAGRLDAAGDIFYLKLEEVEVLVHTPLDVRETIRQRKQDYELYALLDLPARVITTGKPTGTILMPAPSGTSFEGNTLQGIPCSKGVVTGKVYKADHAADLQSVNGGILATYATDPGYVVLFAGTSGIVTERGSLLSHAAIVSREMGIPCIVGVDGLMQTLKDGDEIMMDGSTGVIKILNR